MKLALIFIVGFIVVKSQHILYYPSSFNNLIYKQANHFPVPWYRFIYENSHQGLPDQGTDNYGIYDEPSFQANFSTIQEKISPRFLLSNRVNNFLIGGNSNLALKTYVYTTIKTKTVITTSLCIPSTNVIAGATTCARRRRDMEANFFGLKNFHNGFFASESLEPSPTLAVETTILPMGSEMTAINGASSNTPAISSSKMENMKPLDSMIYRSKRFLNTARYTYTSWKFTTSTVGQPVNIRFLLAYAPCAVGNVPPAGIGFVCALGCIPPGYSTCSTSA